MGDELRADVRIATVPQDLGEDEDRITEKMSEQLMVLARPAPPVCARHGEAEVERRGTTLHSTRRYAYGSFPLFSQDAVLEEELVYFITLEWPLCAQCLATRQRWNKGALIPLFGFFVALVAVIYTANTSRSEAVISLGVFAIIGLLLLAGKMRQRGRSLTGAIVERDGSALLVPSAHPNFVRMIDQP
ncbi:hypothetical protein [Rhodococcus daqingensis]|uniref:DUF3040 domain-containing protein n=1 Tax=Rhodococcus daqingensis TaxID=2479363 RepID=A0ABW2S525_9NOCA